MTVEWIGRFGLAFCVCFRLWSDKVCGKRWSVVKVVMMILGWQVLQGSSGGVRWKRWVKV